MLTRTKLATWYSYNGIGAPAYSLNFLLGALDGSLTFTRASSGWYYNSSGVLTQAATNVPRFDYNPSTLALNGLLIEQQSTNCVLYSNNMTGTYWSAATGGSVTTGNIDLFGTSTANAFKEDTSTGTHAITVTAYSLTNGGTYTTSVYLKPLGSGVYVYINGSTTGGGSANINMTTGATFGSSTGTITSRLLANGFVEVTLTNAISQAYNTVTLQMTTSAGGAQSLTGDGASGFILGGIQIEKLAFATSFIPTNGSAATRATDVLVNTNIGGWYNSSQGTVSCKYMLEGPYASASGTMFALTNGSTSFIALYAGYYGTPEVDIQPNNLQIPAGNSLANTVYNYSTSYQALGIAAAQNGVLEGTLGALVVPTGINELVLGNGGYGAPVCAWLRNFSYYNTALTNAQLTTLSGQL